MASHLNLQRQRLLRRQQRTSSGSSVGGGYVDYSGSASGFPDPSTWADYGTL